MNGVRLTSFEQIFLDPDELGAVLQSAARRIAAKARVALRKGSPSGRRYIKGGKSWTASAAGEAPARFTGTLANSVRVDRPRGKQLYRVVRIRAPHQHWLFLPGGHPFITQRTDVLAEALEADAPLHESELWAALGRAIKAEPLKS